MTTAFETQVARETLYVNDEGDCETDAGGLRLDTTPRSKCLLALRARRGAYWADPTYGSRFREIKTLEEGQQNAEYYAREALQFLMDRGEILDVHVTDVRIDVDTGWMAVAVSIKVTREDLVNIAILAPLRG
jgi:phage gp46-like protein